MKGHPNAVRLLGRRIRRYGNMAVAYQSLSLDRRRYVEHKLSRVVPNLERAIAKALQGTRSVCDDCEEDIPEARLRAVPGAIRCLICQKKEERRQSCT